MTRKMITLRFNNAAHIIASDEDGLFNLNELHRASGFTRKRPSKWMENQTARGLIAELNLNPNSGSAIVTRRGGANPGTWAIEQLVYAYTAWLSPDFHAAIIEAFTALANNNVKKAKEIVRTAVRVEGIITGYACV
ncbi:KilA-N domain-containing protein [Klebsiella aerogenes]|uniref:KilA-N domain-containing protein n=1 Tax=Klebsiella aerogenes TaxID=548 RepID=UPI002B27BA72|nr:KilA-N domain-containing protein [Klebsiella aerogenes]MEA8782135.1 KilA-N domain-containing protein [Klebsiella aerogenes]